MPLREQTPTPLILSIAALALAILAGAVIAISGGGGGDAETLRWTPPAPTIAAAATLPTQPAATWTAAPTRKPAATLAPTATPTAARPTATLPPPETPTAIATVAPQARILQGPANLRSGPGRDFGVTRVANEGETFEVTGQTADGAWVRLCCVNDAAVWVAGELVELPAGLAVPVVK